MLHVHGTRTYYITTITLKLKLEYLSEDIYYILYAVLYCTDREVTPEVPCTGTTCRD